MKFKLDVKRVIDDLANGGLIVPVFNVIFTIFSLLSYLYIMWILIKLEHIEHARTLYDISIQLFALFFGSCVGTAYFFLARKILYEKKEGKP